MLKNSRKRRLSFLRILFNALKVRIDDIPSTIIQPGALRAAFYSADDTRLSVIRKIVEYFGYRLHIKLVPLRTMKKPNQKYKNYNPAKTLSFLREFISAQGMTQEQFGVSLGLTRDAVTYWLKQDDMTLSRLYYVAFVTDSDLRISITPQKEFETRAAKAITTITLREQETIHKGLLGHRHGEEDM